MEQYKGEDPEADFEWLLGQVDHVGDFLGVWTRFGNWTDRNGPVVVRDEAGRIVGLHAATYGLRRPVYVNSYYLAIAPEYQGQRLGGDMLDEVLFRASVTARAQRLKFRTRSAQGDGTRFWSGFGLRPMGQQGQELLWDEDIQTATNCARLIEWMKQRGRHEPIPPAARKRYEKMEGFRWLERE